MIIYIAYTCMYFNERNKQETIETLEDQDNQYLEYKANKIIQLPYYHHQSFLLLRVYVYFSQSFVRECTYKSAILNKYHRFIFCPNEFNPINMDLRDSHNLQHVIPYATDVWLQHIRNLIISIFLVFRFITTIFPFLAPFCPFIPVHDTFVHRPPFTQEFWISLFLCFLSEFWSRSTIPKYIYWAWDEWFRIHLFVGIPPINRNQVSP